MTVRGMGGLIAGLLITVNASPTFAALSNMAPQRSVSNSDAFYDDHYGTFYDGYWTAGGEYFYTTGRGRPYVRDDGHHFSRVMSPGFRPVEALASGRGGDVSASR